MCALVGEASSGKSTVLTAIWTLLEAAAPPPTIADISHGTSGRIHLEAELEKGASIFLDARPPDTLNLNRAGSPPVLFLPANLRPRNLVAPATGVGASDVAELFQPPYAAHHWSQADGGAQLVAGMERLLASNLRRFVLLIEEPELYLSPHLQRHLFNVLRKLAHRGNQILYSTHAPVFLSVDRIEDLALVRHTNDHGTTLFQPEPLAEAEAFRVLSEFDSDRAELFPRAGRAARGGPHGEAHVPVRVRGARHRARQGGDPHPRVRGEGEHAALRPDLQRVRHPVRDRARPRRPQGAKTCRVGGVINQQIQDVAGRRRTVVLVPDFEAVSGSPPAGGDGSRARVPALHRQRRGAAATASRRRACAEGRTRVACRRQSMISKPERCSEQRAVLEHVVPGHACAAQRLDAAETSQVAAAKFDPLELHAAERRLPKLAVVEQNIRQRSSEKSHSVIRQSRKTTRSSFAIRSPTRSRRQSVNVTSESIASASSAPVSRHRRSSTRRATSPRARRFAQSRFSATASTKSSGSATGSSSARSGGYGTVGAFPVTGG